MLIDEMNITYNSTAFKAMEYNKMLVNGAEATEGSMLQIADQLRDYVKNNFIKVYYLSYLIFISSTLIFQIDNHTYEKYILILRSCR